MSIQSLPQTLPTGARTTQRRRLLAGIGLLAIAAALTIAFFAAPARAPQAQPTQAIFIDPATQSVNGYLRAHALVASVVPSDPATQSVHSYLRAHALVASVAPSDPATQSVNSYLRAHGWHGTPR